MLKDYNLGFTAALHLEIAFLLDFYTATSIAYQTYFQIDLSYLLLPVLIFVSPSHLNCFSIKIGENVFFVQAFH